MEKNKYYAAADIGGTSIKLGLFGIDGGLVQKWSIPTDLKSNGDHILENTVRNIYEKAGDETVISGIGIGVPGAVDDAGTVHRCVNLGWGRIDLETEARKLVYRLMPDRPIPALAFGNDADMAAAGELHNGAGKIYNSVCLVTLGTGVGGGYAARGHVVCGAHGAAGEIGHIIINPNETASCTCGRKGCLEQYASADGMVRLARNIMRLRDGACGKNGGAETLHIERLFKIHIPEGASRLDEPEEFSAREICAFADAGDSLCRYIIGIFGKCLGLALSSVSCSIDPEAFIIGGGLSEAAETVLGPVRKAFREYAYPAAAETEIIRAKLGNDAGIYGCAIAVREKAEAK